MGIFYEKQIRVKKDNKTLVFDVEVTDIFGNPDCRIGNFGYNYWFRTNKAINKQEYKSNKQMEMAVRLSMVKRGYKFIEWFNTTPF